MPHLRRRHQWVGIDEKVLDVPRLSKNRNQQKKRIDNSEIASFCVKQNIKSYNDLLISANERKENGLCDISDISDFLFRKPEKQI